jgi:gliding motility-associated-like protein
MNNLTLSAILLPKLSYRRAKAITLALAITCAFVSASAAKPIPVANNRHATAFASTITSFAPASGAPGTLVTVTGTGFTAASTLIIGGKAAIVTSFTATQIVGMVMPGAVTGKVTVNTGADVNSAANFTVTPTPYPTQQLGAKLADTTYHANAFQQEYAESHGGLPLPATSYRYKNVKQGNNVVVSADGNTAVAASLVGLNYETQQAYAIPGGLTFYEKHNGAWVQTGSYFLNFSIGPAPFGKALALNANGTVLFVTHSADFDPYNAPISVFEKQNGVWKPTTFQGIGQSVAVSADGNTAVTGYGALRYVRGGVITTEYTTVYHRINGNLAKDPTLPGDGSFNLTGVPDSVKTVDFGENKQAGGNVALSADGKTLAATSYSNGTFIMKWNGSQWVKEELLTGAAGLISLSADGNVLISTNAGYPGNTAPGYTKLYTRTGSAWSSAQIIPEAGTASITADGNIILFSGNSGPVIYTRNNAGVWVKQNTALSAGPATSVAISADGTSAFSGNVDDNSVGQVKTKIYTSNTVYENGQNTTTTDTTYRTDPYGSLTAYSVAPPMSIASVSPTTGPVGTLVKVTGVSLEGATLSIGGKDAIVVSNTGTVITGMVMPGAVTGAVSVTKGTAVTGGNFTVTATLYPNVPQSGALVDTTYTKPQTSLITDVKVNQGLSVAVSADGNTAVVGTGEAMSNIATGGVLFYKRTNGIWTKDGPLLGANHANVSSVAISADGNTAISGSRLSYASAANIYSRINGVWTVTGGTSGANVGISADGNTVIAGTEAYFGAAYMLKRDGSTWSNVPIPGVDNSAGPNGTVPGNFRLFVPARVAISADSKTLVVVVPGTPQRTNYVPGITNIYTRASVTDNFTLERTMPEIGVAVALNADGNTMLVDNTAVYTRPGAGNPYTQITTIPGAGQASMSADAKTIMYSQSGPVAFTLSGSTYSQQTIPGIKYAGSSVGISADGTTAFLGNSSDTSVVTHPPLPHGPAENTSPPLPLGAAYAFVSGTPANAPSGYANTLTFTNTTTTSTTLSWVKGNGGLRAVFIGVKGTAAPLPADFTTYNANAAYGSGKPLGIAGWYCVYNGDGSSVNISNLLAGTTYRAEVIEYNGNNGNERYLTSRFAPADVTTLFAAGTVQASAVTFAGTTGTTTTVNWVNGNGTGRVVFINKTNSGAPLPANVYYSANNRYTSGNQIGTTGWYCIYNGTGTTVNVVGLASAQTYRVAVVEYSGNIAAPKYLATGIVPANVSTPIEAPSGYSTALTFSNTTATSSTLSWTSGNGAARIVFIKKGTSGGFTPQDGVGYAPNNPYTQGFAISDGWYCVYRGTGNSVNLLGLSPNSTYRVAVVDYNGSGNTGGVAYGKRFNSENVTTLPAPNVQATPPTGYAVSLAFSNTASTSTTLSWVNSNGAARAVFVRIGTSGALGVTQGTTYTANSTFAAGTQAGTSGWFCVYNGTGNSVNIVGLNPSTTYRATVIEYNGAPGLEGYNLSRYNGANVTTTVAPALILTTNQKRMLVEQDVIADDATAELNVHQGVSPNGDGVNDVFTIDGIGAYPENTVKVINNSGEVIYSATGYNNYSKAFDGRAANGTLQKAGTYFYSLEYKKGAEVIRKTGYLILKF